MLTISLQNFTITTLSWDTRTIEPGDWYIPNIGDSFDGHDFINQAFEKGASGSFCQKDRIGKVDERWHKKLLIYETIDLALTALVETQVSKIRELKPEVKIVTVTGTSGKTTTREMMVFMFEKFGKVLSAKTNYNTFWGNAYMLSQFDNHDFLVLETGLGEAKEVRIQTAALKPDIGLLLNIGIAHAGLAGGEEGVFTGKKAIADIQTSENRFIALNIDDAKVHKIYEEYKDYSKLLTVGKHGATITYRDNKITAEGTDFTVFLAGESHTIHIAALGEKYVYNAMLAITAGIVFGFAFAQLCVALNGYQSFTGRFEVVKLSDTVTLINDAYNANPTSFENGLTTLKSAFGGGNSRLILVLGDMAELGDEAENLHKELGNFLRKLSLHVTYYVGKFGHYVDADAVEDSVESVAMKLKSDLLGNTNGLSTIIYTKASNSKRLYKLPELLQLGANV